MWLNCRSRKNLHYNIENILNSKADQCKNLNYFVQMPRLHSLFFCYHGSSGRQLLQSVYGFLVLGNLNWDKGSRYGLVSSKQFRAVFSKVPSREGASEPADCDPLSCLWLAFATARTSSHVAPLGSPEPPLQSGSTATCPHSALMPRAVPSG